MKEVITYRENEVDTTCGYSLNINIICSSYDKNEIDALKNKLMNELGYCAIMEDVSVDNIKLI